MKTLKVLPDLRKKADITSTMKCIFGIKDLETKVYIELLKNSGLTVSELTEKFGKDRSTIQRALQNLSIAGLIYREQRNIKEGGYYYVYYATPFEEVKDKIVSAVKNWCNEVMNVLESLEKEIKKGTKK